MKKLLIRRASPWDVIKIARIIDQGENDHAGETVHAMKKISHVLALLDVGFVIVAEAKEDRRIVASIGFKIEQDGWSDEWMMTNSWVSILPSYRESDVSKQMLLFAELWADDQVNPDTEDKLPISINLSSEVTSNFNSELLMSNGYQHVGSNFVRV